MFLLCTGGAIIEFNKFWGTREVKVQRGGSCLLLSFHCNHLPQCWKNHALSGLLTAK